MTLSPLSVRLPARAGSSRCTPEPVQRNVSAVADVAVRGQAPAATLNTGGAPMAAACTGLPAPSATVAGVTVGSRGASSTPAPRPPLLLDTCAHSQERATMLGRLSGNPQQFPRLAPESFELLAAPDRTYNCQASALGVVDAWVEPPLTMSGQDALYTQHGYVPLGAPAREKLALEPGREKLLVFGVLPGSWAYEKLKDHYEDRCESYRLDEGPIFRHVIRQEPTGTWLSKNGADELVRVADPHVLGGGNYGEPLRVYVRAVPSGPLGPTSASAPAPKSG